MFKRRSIDSDRMRSMFETRSHAWQQVGLANKLSPRVVKRARLQLVLSAIVLAGVLVAYHDRKRWFGVDYEVRVAAAILLMVVGWSLARNAGRALGPILFRRLDPGTAGTVGFLVRLVTVLISAIVALRVAGVDARSLAVGGAFTAVIVGLAAQQTFGNLFAGMVLLSARPFRVGERVRFQGGPLAGRVEGVVSSLGLLYTTLQSGDNTIMVPNSVVLAVAVVPLREPDGVDLIARLPANVTPTDVQELLEARIDIEVREAPQITLEELHGDEVVVRIQATPRRAADGEALASEVLRAVAELSSPDTAAV